MQSWSLAAYGDSDTSVTISAENAKSYVFGVRAGNNNGWSAWVNSAAAGPYVPPLPDPPAAVSSVSVTRADGTLTASWDAPSEADKYHVTYTSDYGQTWTSAADAHASTSITISVVNAKAYTVGVRAGNDGGWSGWTNSPIAHSYFPPERGIRIQDSGGNAITALAVPEGGEASYQVVLTAAPSETTKVCVYISVRDKNDPDITFKGEAVDIVSIDVVFTPDNWNIPQTVTLVAAEDDDYANGARDSGLDARDYYAGKVDLAVTEIDNDAPPAPASVNVTRADGTLTVSGYAVDGASKYHVTYSSDGMKSWTAAADSHGESSITISGIDNDATYVVGVRAGADGGWSGWTNSDAAGPYLPAPTGLTVTPSYNNLNVSWNAVSGATGYDVRSSTDGSSWTTEHSNVSGTSASVANANDAIEHIGVRARNASSASAWTEISRSPAHDWLTTMQPAGASAQSLVVAAAQSGASAQSLVMAAARSGASAQSVQGQSQLTAPTLGTITRDNGTRANGYDQSITVNWTAVTGATGYYVVCSDTGWSWWNCGTFRANEPRTVTIDNDASGEDLGRYRSYVVGVRAVNDNHNEASNWTDSADIRPVTGNLLNLSRMRGNGSITLSWSPSPWTTGYQVHCAEADMTPPYSASVYTLCATLTGQLDTAASHSVTIPHSTNSTYTIDNTKTYDIKIVSTNQWGQGEFLVPLVFPLSVGAADVGQTTAKLKVSNYTGAWWYKRTVPSGDNTCHSVTAGTTEASLSSLTAGVAYTYKTYSKTGCNSADEIATVSFFTGSSVSNLSAASDTYGIGIDDAKKAATQFTTGDAAAGYTLESVTIDIVALASNAGNITVAIHAVSASRPAPTALYTLSGANPTATGHHTFTCPTNVTCTLAKERSYFVVLSQTGGGSGGTRGYTWDTTASTAQTNEPGDFGWSIADTGLWYYSNAWHTQTGWTGMFKVSAMANPTLTVSDATAQTAKLTVANHSGSWWYKATSGPHTTCQGPVSGASANLIGLTKGNTYTYSAYSDSGCSTLLATAAAFTTPTITVSGIGDTSATLIITNYGGTNWWYKMDSGPYTACQGPYIGRSTVALSGLTSGTPYNVTAYSKSGCASDDLVTRAFFTTTAVTLAASNFADTTATLTIAGHTGNWYYKANAAPDNTCKGPVSTASKNLTGLTSGTSYVYKAYSDSGCTTANLLATASSFSVGASHVTNLQSVKTGQSNIGIEQKQAVAFTTGASVNGYTLTSITAPLRQLDTGATQTVTLHQMAGAGTYSTSSTPSTTVLATLSGTDPSSTAWADTTYTCSGSGCSLSANTTYFVMVSSSRNSGNAWAAATTNSESTYPSNSGWDIGFAHEKSSATRPWYSSGNKYHPVRVDFTTVAVPTLTSSNVTATGATLTIANHAGDWYYQYTSPTGGTCSASAVTGTSTTVTLTAGTTYTFAAYSDSSCSTLVATAAAFTTQQQAVSVSNLSETSAVTSHGLTTAIAQEFRTGANTGGYTLSSAQVHFGAVITASAVSVTIREKLSNGRPDTTVLATLSGTAANGASTFTCNTGCDLSASTSYFVYVSGTGINPAYVSLTASDTETGASGWSIANAARAQQNVWGEFPGSLAMKIKVTATPK